MGDLKHEDLTGKIIGTAFTVHNELGYGFLEKVYQNALCIELNAIGLKAEKEKPVIVKYKGHVVGDYIADIVVEDMVILELKAFRQLIEIHEVQLVNYLIATGIEIGLLINFGPSVEVRRKILD